MSAWSDGATQGPPHFLETQDEKRQKELAKQKKKREEEQKRAKALAKKGTDPKVDGPRREPNVHQHGSNSGGAKPRKRGASVLDESNRGKKRIEVTSEEGREEIFDEDGFMIVQDVPFDELIWVEVTKLDGKKARGFISCSVQARERRRG